MILDSFFGRISRYLLDRLETPVASYDNRMINNMKQLGRTIRPGDVLLVEGSSRLSQIIKVLSQSCWSHVAFYVGDLLTREPWTEQPEVIKYLKNLDEFDKTHMLIEADSVNGVYPIPLRRYRNYNIRVCRPFGIAGNDLDQVISEIIGNLGKHYDHRNILDLALLLLPNFANPFKKRTIKACLGGCTEYQVICSGMIARAFQNVRYPIVPALQKTDLIDSGSEADPYGSKLIMRHFSQIMPRDFDISPNFEVIKYNIIGLEQFDYRSLWIE